MKNRIAVKRKMPAVGWAALSFLLPAMVMILGLEALHVIPFGGHTLALFDGKYYLNGLMNFSSLLRGERSVLYSFSGLGANNWSSLSWGVFAPASVLSLFATLESMPLFFTWISLVNLALCGLTMYLLLREYLGDCVDGLIFSTSYAMIGFNVVNCFQTLFFIGPQMLPLVVLGLVRMMRGKNPVLYILSLAFCIFSNFYFGFMLCVASVTIFLAHTYAAFDSAEGWKGVRWKSYVFSSAIAGLLPAFFWLPALKAFSGGGRLNQTTVSEYVFTEKRPFLQIFSKLFSGAVSNNEIIDGLPNIFSGILVVALAILYFMDEKVPVRRKKTVGVVLGFYLVTFYIPAFTILMHGGTHTNWFPYRYSYVFSFFLIATAAEEFRNLDTITLKDTLRCGKALLLGTILVFSTQYAFVSGGAVLFDLTLLVCMWVGFHAYKTKPDKAPKRTLSLLLALLVCMNLYGNYVLTIYKMIHPVNDSPNELDLEQYAGQVLESGALVEAIQTIDDSFFRMEKGKSESFSVGADPLLYGYYGVSASGPAIRAFVHSNLCKLGIGWFDMRHWYEDGVPAATDCLLGLKYLISSSDLKQEKDYKKLVGTEKNQIYQNDSALGIASLSNAAIQKVELTENVFDNLNQIWRSMTGENRDIFVEPDEITFTLNNTPSTLTLTSRDLKKAEEKNEKTSQNKAASQSTSTSESEPEEEKNPLGTVDYSFVADRDGPVYLLNLSVPTSDNGSTNLPVKCLGVFATGETVSGSFPITERAATEQDFREFCSTVGFAYADNAALADYAKLINSRKFTVNVEREHHITGTFTAEKNQRILFTFPWDEGWTCYIDGEKVPIDKTWDLFMSVEVPEGAHTWEMRFFPAWMDIGIGISGAALLGLVMLMVFWRRSENARMSSANQGR